MTLTTDIHIEDHSAERVVSFFADCSGPEGPAWEQMRAWVREHVPDYQSRRYIGCAPKGHHPNRDTHHQPDEGPDVHPYLAQMLLKEGETFQSAEILPAPWGEFLVGEVTLDVFFPDGSLDLGACMEKSFGAMAQWLKDTGGYEFAFGDRPYHEEHFFSGAWFEGQGELAGFKLWLPVRKA